MDKILFCPEQTNDLGVEIKQDTVILAENRRDAGPVTVIIFGGDNQNAIRLLLLPGLQIAAQHLIPANFTQPVDSEPRLLHLDSELMDPSPPRQSSLIEPLTGRETGNHSASLSFPHVLSGNPQTARIDSR